MITAIIGSIFITFTILFYLIVSLGYPYGEYIMGGKYKIFPVNKRFLLIAAIIIQLLMMLTLLQAGWIINLQLSNTLVKIIGYIFATYISLNVFMNLFSKSKKEKYLMTPISLTVAVCFWLTLTNMPN